VRLFIDTWGWITLANKRESQHTVVSRFLDHFWNQGGITYTSDYVLDETITLLFRWLPFETAKAGLERIEKAAQEGYLRLERITQDRFEKAKRLRLKFRDKPLISFTDLTSMIVMQERRLKQILTEDDHFTHVGMGLERAP
jgi:predicted nucleic acid-binding protein